MLSFIKILIIFFIFHSNRANKTELQELLKESIEDLKEEFNYRLNTAIKIKEIHEKRIEEMMKKYSDLNDKFYDINNKICYPKEFRSEKINKTDEEIENQINSFVENKSKSLLFIFNFSSII
jgi:patatin-like phospholipase/acyl hydrolase